MADEKAHLESLRRYLDGAQALGSNGRQGIGIVSRLLDWRQKHDARGSERAYRRMGDRNVERLEAIGNRCHCSFTLAIFVIAVYGIARNAHLTGDYC